MSSKYVVLLQLKMKRFMSQIGQRGHMILLPQCEHTFQWLYIGTYN